MLDWLKLTYMRKFLSLIVVGLLAFSPLAITGCKTTSNPSGLVTVGGVTLDPKVTGSIVRIAAKLGAVATINAKPETRQYFSLSVTAINTAISEGTYDPNAVKSAVTSAGGAEAAESIADALQLYQSFFGDIVNAKLTNASPYAEPVLKGLSDGIQDAVNATGTKGAYHPVKATRLK